MKVRSLGSKYGTVGVASLFACIVLVGCSTSAGTQPGDAGTTASVTTRTQAVEMDSAFDVTDPQQLAGWADAVFVGTVIEQVGTKAVGPFPETQFSVEVLQTLKGDVAGQILVNQQGGYGTDGTLYLLDDDPLIEPGATYLMSAGFLPSENWDTVAPRAGKVTLSAEEVAAVSDGTARRSTDEPAPVATMRDAIDNEIPFDPNRESEPVSSEPPVPPR